MFKKSQNFNKIDSLFYKKKELTFSDTFQKENILIVFNLQSNCNGENTKNGLVITFDRGP